MIQKLIRLLGALLLFFLVITPQTAVSQQLRQHPNNAFGADEFTSYWVYYRSMLTGNVTAGEATIAVSDTKRSFDNREVWHIVGEGRSKGAFNFFFKVRDRFESFVDKEAMIPYLFVRRTREGGYVKDDDVYFLHDKQVAKSRTATKAIPKNVQDFVSAVFFMRTLQLSDFDKDSSYYIDFFLDDSVYVSKIKYLGTESIQTNLGIFRCLKFAPMMATGNVFADAYPIFIWISDDENHLPIMAEAKVIIGSVRVELMEVKNPRNPISSRLKD